MIELSDGVRGGVENPDDDAAFTLTETESDDPRLVTVDSITQSLGELRQRCERRPQAAAVCVDVLRSVDVAAPAFGGVITESLARSA